MFFFLLLSVSHGYSHSLESDSYESEPSKKALILLQKQLERYVDSLMSVLLDEDTPRKNQMEILNELRAIADVNGKIVLAMDQISQSDIGQNKIDTNKDSDRDEDIGRYVAELREESLSDDNYPAFEFLQTRIGEELEKTIKNPKIPQEIILDAVKSITGGPNELGEFEREYPNQKELSEKLKVFVGSYIEMWKNIKEL